MMNTYLVSSSINVKISTQAQNRIKTYVEVGKHLDHYEFYKHDMHVKLIKSNAWFEETFIRTYETVPV